MSWKNIIDDDELPRERGDYLVYMTGDGVHFFQDVAWYSPETGFTDKYDITHWRHLPEDPDLGRTIKQAPKQGQTSLLSIKAAIKEVKK